MWDSFCGKYPGTNLNMMNEVYKKDENKYNDRRLIQDVQTRNRIQREYHGELYRHHGIQKLIRGTQSSLLVLKKGENWGIGKKLIASQNTHTCSL
jgi:hypothetical protein